MGSQRSSDACEPGRRRFLVLAGRSLAAGAAGLLWTPGLARAQEKARAIHQATRNTLRGAVGVRLRQLFGDGRPKPYKPYPDAARTPLPAAASQPARSLAAVLADPSPAAGTGRLSLPTLTRLLEAANGVTGRGPGGVSLRAAPSAGALYAGELYVAVERVEGLEPGLYYYAPLTRELARLRKGSQLAELSASLEQPERARAAAAAVLLTSVFPRYRWRYANRGYRYALIDTGHIGHNLALSAASAGVSHGSPARFHDERLCRLLAIDGLDEAVCAVHLLGAPGAPPGDTVTRPLVEAGVAGRPLPEAADDAPERYHAATRLLPATGAEAPPHGDAATAGDGDPAEAPAATEPAAPAGEADGGAQGEAVALAPRRDPGLSIERAIRKRRSAQRFADGPVSAEDLGFVLGAALGPAAAARPPLELLVFVHRARGAAAGLYRARRAASGAAELVLLRQDALDEALVDVCLGQEKAGQAAVGIAAVGDLATAAAQGGDRSYRDLCLEAGAAAQRVYLAAESVGLAARNLSAFVDDRLNELAGLDGRRRGVLHLTMLGPGV